METTKRGAAERRCVVIGGADIGRYDRIRARLREDDFFICCDGGLRHRGGLGIAPDLVVGDFDSHENPHLPVETIVLPCEKDDTDTVFAVRTALDRGFQDFLLLGCTGGRLDHTLGNVSLLLMLEARGKRAVLLDDFSEMEVVSAGPVQIEDRYACFSLLSAGGAARGVTVRGVKYPLSNAEITSEYQYGISNEVLPGERAEVSVREGRLLLVKVLPLF